MTDGGYGQPPQGGYPPTPPPPPPPPPGVQPYQPQPTSPQPGAPAPAPARKKRGAAIVAGIAGVLLLCGLLVCVALAIGGGLFENKTKKAVAAAEVHYSAAMSAVETASAAIKQAPNDAAKAGPAIKTATSSLEVGRGEIDAAREEIQPLADSRGKAQYLASLNAADEAFDALSDMLAYLNTASGMIGKVQKAGDMASAANDALNGAISAGNREDYTAMKNEAGKASADYGRAAQMFREAHALDKSAGLDKAAAYAAKRKEQADLVRKMADEGKAGKVNTYNKDIDRMKQLGDQAEKIGDPAIVSDPQWAQKRLANLEQRITDAGDQADELRSVALKEFGLVD